MTSIVALADEPPVAPARPPKTQLGKPAVAPCDSNICELCGADGGEDSFAAGAFPVGVDHDFD